MYYCSPSLGWYTSGWMKKKALVISLNIVAALIIGGLAAYFFAHRAAAPTQQSTTNANSNTDLPPAEEETSNAFDKTQHSLTDPASLWVVVNKLNPLNPQQYAPNDLVLPNVSQRIPGVEQMKLRQAAAASLERMFTAAAAEGLHLQITTAFRGYNYQRTLYTGYVASEGQAAADTQSARPGYSEHQTGWAVDIRPQSGQCYLEACFGDMAEGKWLAENAHTYGFLLRYPADKAAVTGYTYEPWHFRYVGQELTAEMRRQNITTLEEFFGLPAAPTYEG